MTWKWTNEIGASHLISAYGSLPRAGAAGPWTGGCGSQWNPPPTHPSPPDVPCSTGTKYLTSENIAAKPTPPNFWMCEDACCPLDFSLDWPVDRWLHVAMQALATLISGTVSEQMTFKPAEGLMTVSLYGAEHLANVFAGQVQDPQCTAPELYQWWNHSRYWQQRGISPCMDMAWSAQAWLEEFPALPSSSVRSDEVGLFFTEVYFDTNGIIRTKAAPVRNLTLFGLSEVGKVCVWNYFWACRLAYRLLIGASQDDFTYQDLESWVQTVWANGGQPFLTIPPAA
jgi:hypothetical protein